jgi:hypothetical protein
MKSTVKRIATTAAATGVLAVAMPAAGASAAALPVGPLPNLQMPGMKFTPPAVGQISVDIGPTIIGGKVIDPGLHVSSPGAAIDPIVLPPSNWPLPPRP